MQLATNDGILGAIPAFWLAVPMCDALPRCPDGAWHLLSLAEAPRFSEVTGASV